MDMEIVNVVVIFCGMVYLNCYVIMSGDIDLCVFDVNDGMSDFFGVNDNVFGMVGVVEVVCVLSQYEFLLMIVFVGFFGEEQGLFGGWYMVEIVREEGWQIVGVFNNDMIGNIYGIDGVIVNDMFWVFFELMLVIEIVVEWCC